MSDTLRLGTRGSTLARIQTEHVVKRLGRVAPDLDVEVVEKETSGDRFAEQSIHKLSGKGFFTKDLDEAVRSGEIDAAVHSAKDVPTDDVPGLVTIAYLDRSSAADVLVTRAEEGGINQLPEGGSVGTSSLRRRAQLLSRRPDLDVRPIRGNVDTRLEKLFEREVVDALVLAEAGLARLGRTDVITARLTPSSFVSAPGQGAILLQCREASGRLREALADVSDDACELAVTVERRIIEALEGGCRIPLGAYCEVHRDGPHRVHGMVASFDGDPVLTARTRFDAPEGAAEAAGRVVRELKKQGAQELISSARDYLREQSDTE